MGVLPCLVIFFAVDPTLLQEGSGQMLLRRPSLPFAAGNLSGGEDNVTKQRLTLQNSSAASGAVWSITDQ